MDGVSESVRMQQNDDAEKFGADGDAIAIIDGLLIGLGLPVHTSTYNILGSIPKFIPTTPLHSHIDPLYF